MKKILLVLTTIGLLFTHNIFSQNLTIIGEDATACENSTVSVEVSVSNFIDISSGQFGITWDPAVVEFVDVDDNMPNPAIYNVLNAATGELRFSWFDVIPPPGYTPAGPPVGSDVIFTINFNVLGDYTTNSFTDITFGSVPGFNMEFANTSGLISNSDIVLTHGSVTIEDVTAPIFPSGCPVSITETAAMGQTTVVVNYTSPAATDNCDTPTVTCAPASGTAFPIGTTQVTCTATDGQGNPNQCTFNVTVNPAAPNPNAVTFTAEDVALPCDETTLYVPITVANFELMTSMQYGLEWDETILDYVDHIDNLNSTGHFTAIYNNLNVADGEFRFSWFDANGAPAETLPDGDTLFTLEFTALNTGALPTDVAITSFPGFSIEIANSSGILSSGDYVLENSTVTLTDEPPVMTGCDDISMNNDAGMCGAIVTWTAPTATDDCDNPDPVPMQVSGPASGTFFPIGIETISYTVADSQGQDTTCTFTVTVVENEAPVAMCQNISVWLDGTGDASIIVSDVDNGSTDNCDSLTLSIDVSSFDCSDVGTPVQVTLTATDTSSNSHTCMALVTVLDTILPMAVCQNDTLYLNANGMATLTPMSVDNGSSDNCDIDDMTVSQTDFGCSDTGDNAITLTVTDASGNVDSCMAMVTVLDTISPMAVCKNDTVYLDGMGGVAIAASVIDGGSSDNCDITSASTTPFSFDCSNIGDNSVTLTVGDATGNEHMCMATVTVLDTIMPMAVCQNDTLYLDGMGGAELTTMDVDNGSADACGIETMTLSQTDFDCSDLGVVTVTLMVTDSSGNAGNCMADITVLDTIPPMAICQNDTLYLDASGSATLMAMDLDNGSTDNCDVDTVTASQTGFSCTDLGDNMVTVYVMDESDNVDSCMATVTVLDTLAPTLTCPTDTLIEVPFGTVDTIINNIGLSASADNCGIDTTYYILTGDLMDDGANDASGTAFPVGMTNVEYFVVDESGNIDSCEFTVTIEETLVLDITCPSNVSQANDMGECLASIGDLGVTVSSGIATDTTYSFMGATSTPGSGMGNINPDPTDFNVGMTTVTYMATNATDTAMCSFTVTIQDTLAPTIICPGPFPVDNTMDSCGLVFSVGFIPAVSDNCPGVDVTTSPYMVGDLVPVGGPHDITAIATDASGNADTCVYQITVNDTQSPTWTGCPSNIDNVPSAPDTCGAIVTWPLPVADDNCGVIAVTPPTNPSGSVFPAGETTLVEYVAVDAAGNTEKCSFTVSVVDTISPTIDMCPNDIVQANDSLECSAVVTWTPPLPDDNCEVVSFVSSGIPTGNIFAVGGPYQIGYSATDEEGNTTVCTFEVTVTDSEFPQIMDLPADITVPAAQGECSAVVNWDVPTASDNCGIQSFMGSNSPGETFAVTSPGVPHVVEYTATDINGNVTNEMFTITVVDDQMPVFDNCPTSNIIVNVDGTSSSSFLTSVSPVDCENIQLTLADLTGADNCGPIAAIAQTFGLGSGDVFPLGINTLTFEATDVNGNQATCSFNIIVEGVPIAGAQASPDEVCEEGTVDFFVSNTVPGATYTWTDPTGAVISNLPSFTLPAISLTQAGGWEITTDLGYCVQMDTVEVQVFENPQVEIDYNDVLCTDGSVPLVLTGVNSGGVVVNEWLWTTPTTPPMMASGQTLTISNPTVDDAGTYTLQATTVNGCSVTVQTDNEVIVSAQPTMPDLTATPSSICLGEFTILNGEPFAGTDVEYQWSADPMVGSGLPVPTPSNPVLEVTPTESGTYTYFYTVIVDGCASQMAEVAVQVEAAPAISIDVDGETTCLSGNTDITLSVNQAAGSPIVDYLWTPGNTTDPTRIITQANSDSSDVYTVMVTTGLGCVGTASVNLNDLTDALPMPTITPTSDSLCLGSNTTVNSFPGFPNGSTFTWWVNGVMQSSSLPALNVAPSNVGTTLVEMYVLFDGCTTDTVMTTIETGDLAPVMVTPQGDTDCLDGTTTVTLLADAPGATMYEWPGYGVFDPELPIPNANQDSSGAYVVIASNEFGCVSQATYVLTLTNTLQSVTAFLESPACELGELQLCAEPTIAGATYEWAGPGGTVVATTQCPTIPNAMAILNGDYQVTATLNGCTSTSEPLTVDVLMPPTANNEVVVGIVDQPQSFNVIVNDVIEGDYTISVVQDPEFGSVVYDGDGVFTYRPQAGFRETDRMAYEICYEDCPEACDIAIVTLLIRFPGDNCVATTVITPNNDGINDEFVVSCLEVDDYPQNTLHIFNEWGDEVYDAAPYDNTWKGTFNGKDLPDGTYFFIFQREPNVPAQKGFVMIHR